MAKIIVDMNIPTKAGQAGYPDYFFHEMNSTSKHHVLFGGTKYLDELRKKEKLQRILIDWLSRKKATRLDKAGVDSFENILRERIIAKVGAIPNECDDLHIIAIASVGNCPNVLTYDQRMCDCKDKVRMKVGVEYFPNIKFVKSKAIFEKLQCI
ncbi:hypothetical protein [Rhodobacter maris]|uniref:PIN domain-containing protein n=1 Tax=Rhodobacter maris TaxID=446682 RepID=A0A285TKT0_9RHOB|nr:hypothetical protein [Rhodobacter maris]SOC23166.1 hypothetical protein SAMN05877831_1384 [Rhodobacter maris]